ncbi:MAG: hypothetical protein IK016_05330 [Lachnospiraceae bacterium]|nr:hypothetical protein [Lachnospiraceae bacterium]
MTGNRNRGIRNLRPHGRPTSYWRDNHRFTDLFNAVLFDGRAFFKPDDLEDVSEDEEDALLPADGYRTPVEIRGGIPTVRVIKRSRKYGASFVLLAVGDGCQGHTLRVSARPESRTSVIALCIHYGEEDWSGTKPEHSMLQLPQDSRFRTPERRLRLIEAKNGDYRFQNDENRHLFTLMRLLADNSVSAAERRKAYRRYCQTHVIEQDTLRMVEAVTGKCAQSAVAESRLISRKWTVWTKQ